MRSSNHNDNHLLLKRSNKFQLQDNNNSLNIKKSRTNHNTNKNKNNTNDKNMKEKSNESPMNISKKFLENKKLKKAFISF